MLTEAGIAFVELGGVVPNPLLSKVKEGIELCRKEKVDFILAVGGGSVIDSAKAIGYGVGYPGDVWDFWDGKATPQSCLPIGVMLTIPAAGSEMSSSCVVTNDEGMLKRGFNSDLCRCKFAIMNPERTYTLPDYQTAPDGCRCHRHHDAHDGTLLLEIRGCPVDGCHCRGFVEDGHGGCQGSVDLAR